MDASIGHHHAERLKPNGLNQECCFWIHCFVLIYNFISYVAVINGLMSIFLTYSCTTDNGMK